MAIKLREDNKIARKVMFMGKDGSGKSTNAYKYCQVKGLNPVCIDFDNTNIGTGCPVMEIDLRSHLLARNNILQAIKDVEDSEYDTLIFDNAGTMIEDISATREKDPFGAAGSDAFTAIMKRLRKSSLNIIFIVQVDFYIDEPDKKQEKNNKKAVALNAWVNEKYYCWKTGDNPSNYEYHCVADKIREVKKDG